MSPPDRALTVEMDHAPAFAGTVLPKSIPASKSMLAGLVVNIGDVSVDRGIAELRAARPVIVSADGEASLIVGVEGLEAGFAATLGAIADGRARLLLPGARLRRLGMERLTAGVLALPVIDVKRIETLSLAIEGKIDAPVAPTSRIDEGALELAQLALILPTMIAVAVEATDPRLDGLQRVDLTDIRAYRLARLKELRIVGRAPVPLEGAPESEFVVFRGGEGMRDQVAIVIGKFDRTKPVAVRIHSACLTGDLFGSLKCDCGDQLRDTARWMSENNGGVILYLDQEGRGNGIANKMRAYKLQSQGFDTYDADEILGFDLDQRHFDFAAEMIRQLGIDTIRLLTNNPEKLSAMREAGIKIVSDQRVIGRPTPENIRYLASKRDRAGHFIDMDAVVARAAIKD